MFVKILREKSFFIYVNKNNIVFIEPNNNGNGVGCNITLVNNTTFYSEEDPEVILSRINN